MRTTKNIIIISGVISLLFLASCGKTLEQKNKDIKASDEKVNVIGIMQKGDPSGCNELQDEQKVKNCVNNLYYNKAIVEKDVTICDKIEKTDSKSLCKSQIFYDQALVNSDKKYCDKIEKTQLKTDCTNNVVINKALQKTNTSLCSEYIGDVKICKDQVNNTLAMSTSDKKYCLKISDAKLKDYCSQSISAATSNSGSIQKPSTQNQIK